MSHNIYYNTSPDDVYEDPIRVPFGSDLPYRLYGGVGEDCFRCTIDDLTTYDWSGHTLVLQVYSDQWSAPDESPLLEIAIDDPLEQTTKGTSEGNFDIAVKTIDWTTFYPTLTPGQQYWYRVKATDAQNIDFIPVRGEFMLETK